MTIARLLLYCLALTLALLLGVGSYYYLNLPSLVEQQAKQYLQDYGVENLRYERLKISKKQLGTDMLYLSGVYDGLPYEATLSSLQVRYNWRKLLLGEVKSVVLDELKLSVFEPAWGPNTDASSAIEVSGLLPQAFLEAMPLQALEIRQWNLTYHPAYLRTVSARGSMQVGAQLSLQLSATHEGADIKAEIWTQGANAYPHANIRLTSRNEDLADLSASITPSDAAHWQWSVEGKLDYKPVLAWLRRADKEMWPWMEVSVLDGLVLDGQTTLRATVTHPDQLQLIELPGQPLIAQFAVEASTANSIEELAYPDSVSGVAGTLAIDLTLDNGNPGLTLGPSELEGKLSTGRLSLPVETRNWLGWKDTLPIKWKNPEKLSLSTVPEGGWLLQLSNNTLALGDQGSKFRWEALDMSATVYPAQPWRIDAEIGSRINARLRKKQLPESNLRLTHSGPLEQSVFNLSLDDIAESMSLKLQGEANLESGRGNYLASFSSGDLAYASETLMPLMRSFGLLSKTQNLAISDGRMSLQSELQGQSFSLAGLKQHSKLSIENVSGIYEDYRFGGVAVNAQWTGTEHWHAKKPVDISMATLNLGFELLDTRMQLTLPEATPIAQPVVNIVSFTSNVFGGVLFMPESQSWDVGGKSNKITLRAEGWRLADMVALQQGQDIQAQGILEGELPVTVSGGRVIISNGYLQAMPPGGIIRYNPNDASEALATSSPELGLALDLLSDFQYEVLRSQVELDESGNLLLGLSLAGKNPAQYEGRPINFNINLEQNLDPLLQSLRLSDKLVEQLEGRIN